MTGGLKNQLGTGVPELSTSTKEECMSILQYFTLFNGVPAPAVGMDGGYYFNRHGNIVGTYDHVDNDTIVYIPLGDIMVPVRPWGDSLD